MNNTRITDMTVYTGKTVVGNEKYLSHFKEKGMDVRGLFEDVLGRDKRYIKDAEENTVTMSVKAINELLERNSLTGEDIDMLVFSSQTPEYLMPATSIVIHREIGGNSGAICYDVNVNCSGMVSVLNTICGQIAVNKNIKRALLVGCDIVNLCADKENPVTYGQFGDAACAMLLESTTEDCGLIGYGSCVDSGYADRIVFPKVGLSRFLDSDTVDRKMDWLPFDGDSSVEPSYKAMVKVLEESNTSIQDISLFAASQFGVSNINLMVDLCKIDKEKMPYIGDKYGYTATTSPMLALYETLQNGKIARGGLIMFWGVGAGWQTNCLLFKY